ncbi:MAG: hypothetical protein U0441_30265 [Polyangiaceae bacterium]
MDLLHPPQKGSSLEESEQYLSDVLAAADRAKAALRTLLGGGTADVEALEGAAQLLEAFRRRYVTGYRAETTQDDVAAARRLVDLVHTGASKAEIVAAAQRVHGILFRPLEPDVSEMEQIERDTLDMLRTRYQVALTEDDVRTVRRLAELMVESWREPSSSVSEELLATMRQIREMCARSGAGDAC